MKCELCENKFKELYEIEDNNKTLIVCKKCFINTKGFMKKRYGNIIYADSHARHMDEQNEI